MKTRTKVLIGVGIGLFLFGGGVVVSRAVVPLWQSAAAWGKKQLGFGTSTIGAGGCLLTLFTMASNALKGTNYTPDVVNEILKSASAFSGSNLVTEKAAAALGLKRGERVYNAAGLRAAVDAALAAGGLAVLQVDHSGDAVGDHFILVNGKNAAGYTAADPAPAKIIQLGPDLGGAVAWGSSTKVYKGLNVFSLTA